MEPTLALWPHKRAEHGAEGGVFARDCVVRYIVLDVDVHARPPVRVAEEGVLLVHETYQRLGAETAPQLAITVTVGKTNIGFRV